MATRLADAGWDVVLVERTTGPTDKVCGEFLSEQAVVHLEALGIDPVALGAVPIDTLRLTCGERTATTTLPFPALSLSRRILDEALLTRAAVAGATLRRGSTVRELAEHSDRWTARLNDGTRISGRLAFLATGKHDLRGWKRPPGMQSDLIGMKVHWRLSPIAQAALGTGVEIVLFPGGYAGLEPVENGGANLCLVVRRQDFAGTGHSWETFLRRIRSGSAVLDHRLDGAEADRHRPLAIGAIPFGYLRRRGEGPWRLGDQAAVVPSFTGTGIAVALQSADLAAGTCLVGGSQADYERELARELSFLVQGGTLASRLAMHPIAQAAFTRAICRSPGRLASLARLTRPPFPRERVRTPMSGIPVR